MAREQRLVNRELQTLPIGTRVRLTSGRTATLVALTFTSATVKIDPGQPPDRRANSRGEVEIAPAAEVELLDEQPAVPVPSTATLEDAASCADVEPLALEHGHRDALARVVPDERSLATPADERGRGTALAVPGMRQAAGGRLLGSAGPPDASNCLADGSPRCALADCGAALDPRTPWQKFCSPAHRQRAYEDRQRAARDASPG